MNKTLSLLTLSLLCGMGGCDKYAGTADLIPLTKSYRPPEIVFNACANKYAVEIGSGKYSYFGKISADFETWFAALGEEYQFDTQAQAVSAWNKYAAAENASEAKYQKEKHPEDDSIFKCEHSYN